MISKYHENESFINKYVALAKKRVLFSNHVVKITFYFSTGTTSQTAVIPTGEGANAGSCVIPAYAEVIVQVNQNTTTPATIYIAAVAASSSPVFVTPVAITG